MALSLRERTLLDIRSGRISKRSPVPVAQYELIRDDPQLQNILQTIQKTSYAQLTPKLRYKYGSAPTGFGVKQAIIQKDIQKKEIKAAKKLLDKGGPMIKEQRDQLKKIAKQPLIKITDVFAQIRRNIPLSSNVRQTAEDKFVRVGSADDAAATARETQVLKKPEVKTAAQLTAEILRKQGKTASVTKEGLVQVQEKGRQVLLNPLSRTTVTDVIAAAPSSAKIRAKQTLAAVERARTQAISKSREAQRNTKKISESFAKVIKSVIKNQDKPAVGPLISKARQVGINQSQLKQIANTKNITQQDLAVLRPLLQDYKATTSKSSKLFDRARQVVNKEFELSPSVAAKQTPLQNYIRAAVKKIPLSVIELADSAINIAAALPVFEKAIRTKTGRDAAWNAFKQVAPKAPVQLVKSLNPLTPEGLVNLFFLTTGTRGKITKNLKTKSTVKAVNNIVEIEKITSGKINNRLFKLTERTKITKPAFKKLLTESKLKVKPEIEIKFPVGETGTKLIKTSKGVIAVPKPGLIRNLKKLRSEAEAVRVKKNLKLLEQKKIKAAEAAKSEKVKLSELRKRAKIERAKFGSVQKNTLALFKQQPKMLEFIKAKGIAYFKKGDQYIKVYQALDSTGKVKQFRNVQEYLRFLKRTSKKTSPDLIKRFVEIKRGAKKALKQKTRPQRLKIEKQRIFERKQLAEQIRTTIGKIQKQTGVRFMQTPKAKRFINEKSVVTIDGKTIYQFIDPSDSRGLKVLRFKSKEAYLNALKKAYKSESKARVSDLFDYSKYEAQQTIKLRQNVKKAIVESKKLRSELTDLIAKKRNTFSFLKNKKGALYLKSEFALPEQKAARQILIQIEKQKQVKPTIKTKVKKLELQIKKKVKTIEKEKRKIFQRHKRLEIKYNKKPQVSILTKAKNNLNKLNKLNLAIGVLLSINSVIKSIIKPIQNAKSAQRFGRVPVSKAKVGIKSAIKVGPVPKLAPLSALIPAINQKQKKLLDSATLISYAAVPLSKSLYDKWFKNKESQKRYQSDPGAQRKLLNYYFNTSYNNRLLIYLPDLVSLLNGVVARGQDKLSLIRKGRLFTGVEERKIVK